MSARPKKTKKIRGTRPRLTHIEVRCGDALRLRLAIADDAIAGVGDELGALVMKIAPGAASTSTVEPAASSSGAIAVIEPSPELVVVSPLHLHDDETYHTCVREQLAEFFESLCDASLDDALEIARQERARRVEGVN